jgi:peptidyl-prolyl cis-trans isomerase SurA
MRRIPQFAARLAIVLLCATTLRLCAQTPVPVPTPAQGVTPVPTTPGKNTSRAASDAAPTKVIVPVLPTMPTLQGTELDRVVAIVNGDLILDSDVDEDLRLDELEPYGIDAGGTSHEQQRTKAIERLINRDLILQQVKLQPGEQVTDAAVEKELDGLRHNIPACRQYQCETQAGWDKLLASNGFTEATLKTRWRERMIVLAFIERRFRLGIKITPAEIDTYYKQTLLPQYAARHAPPPPVEAISDRIQEVLLAQRVSSLLSDWLQSLRAQGNIVLLHPGESAP